MKKHKCKTPIKNKNIGDTVYFKRFTAVVDDGEEVEKMNLELTEIKGLLDDFKLIQEKDDDFIKANVVKCSEDELLILQRIREYYEIPADEEVSSDIYDRLVCIIKDLNIFKELNQEEHIAKNILILITQFYSNETTKTVLSSDIKKTLIHFEIVLKLFLELNTVKQCSEHFKNTSDQEFFLNFIIDKLYLIGQSVGILQVINNYDKFPINCCDFTQPKMECSVLPFSGNETIH